MAIPILTHSLQEAMISKLPESGYYIPNFITPEEEYQLLHKISSAPLPTWRILSRRRLQAYPSPLSSTNTLLAAPLPSWLSDPVVPRMLSLPPASNSQDNIFSNAPHSAPNHCLINEYLPGQGIHAHEDGDAYYPVVATVTLGSHGVLDVCAKREERGKWRILQERRSLLITTKDVYKDCLHGIEAVDIDERLNIEQIVNWELLGDNRNFAEGKAERKTRISLTFRDVLRVKKLGKAFPGKMRGEEPCQNHFGFG